jgi:hypothetical protein
LFISSVSFAELRFGVEIQPDIARRAELTGWLEHGLRPMFDGRVIPISGNIMLRGG